MHCNPLNSVGATKHQTDLPVIPRLGGGLIRRIVTVANLSEAKLEDRQLESTTKRGKIKSLRFYFFYLFFLFFDS